MTALTEYQRLECTGVWRDAPEAQRRDVFVSIGDATLMITDSGNRVLAHWSLPAIIRLNPGERPALYKSGADAPEDLEIADETMIGAIGQVRRAIERRRAKPGRLRTVLLGGGLLAVLALTVFWLPEAVVRQAASVLPEAKRVELGERLLTNIRRVAGKPCDTRNGNRTLERLKVRLLPDRPGRIVVLAGGIPTAGHLPGGLILLNRALVEDYEDPAVPAGYVLAESLRGEITDPVMRLLEFAGPFAAFRLLTTAVISDETLASYAETLMTEPAAPLDEITLLARFAKAGVASTPYAYARDISGETTLPLIEADPAQNGATRPILTDGEWVSLQGICGE
jgi:hypothetical protein